MQARRTKSWSFTNTYTTQGNHQLHKDPQNRAFNHSVSSIKRFPCKRHEPCPWPRPNQKSWEIFAEILNISTNKLCCACNGHNCTHQSSVRTWRISGVVEARLQQSTTRKRSDQKRSRTEGKKEGKKEIICFTVMNLINLSCGGLSWFLA